MLRLRVRGSHPVPRVFPDGFPWLCMCFLQSITPWCTHHGLGSSAFARRYLRNRFFFLFLRLLRCFSSPGSLPCVMDWRMDDSALHCRVSPFGYLRVKRIFAPNRSFSQLITSFFGSQCLGIHPTLLFVGRPPCATCVRNSPLLLLSAQLSGA